MEGARRWRRRKGRRRRSWGQTPPPPSPRLRPALSAAAGGGEGRGCRPRARSPSLPPPPLAGSHSGMRASPTLGGPAGGRRQATSARTRGEGAADARLPPRAAQAGRRRRPPDRPRAGSRAHPCDRQSPGRPALVPAPRSAGLSKSRGRFPRDWSQRSQAVPVDGRARERGPLGSPGLRERGPAAELRRSPGPRGCPCGAREGELGSQGGLRVLGAWVVGGWELRSSPFLPLHASASVGTEVGVGGRRLGRPTPAAGRCGRLLGRSGCTPAITVPGKSRVRLECGALPVWRGSRGRWFDLARG